MAWMRSFRISVIRMPIRFVKEVLRQIEAGYADKLNQQERPAAERQP